MRHFITMLNKGRGWCVFFCLILSVQTLFAQSVNTDMEIARSRLLDLVQENARISEADAERWVDTLKSDGTWPDLDYDRNERGSWPSQTHWRRIRDLSLLLQSGSVEGDQAVRYQEAIRRAIGYWIEASPVAVNWWFNCIGVPLEMGPTLLALGGTLDNEVRVRLLDLMNHPPKIDFILAVDDGAYAQSATGQNLVWLAWIQMMMGLAAENEGWILNAVGEVSDEVVITTAEGIQPDYSFHQHGAQYYAGGYGMSFIRSIGDIITVVHGTDYSLSSEAESVFLDYLLEGQRWIVRGRNVIFHAKGREIARPFSGTSSLGVVAGRMADVGFPRTDELRRLAESVEQERPVSDLNGVRVFYRSDVAIQQNEAFSISVRGTSYRLVAGESGNGENLLGQFLAHGAHAILLQGDEYGNVFPLWDWRKIPGGLIAEDAGLSLFDWGNDKPNQSGFVGGVSSGPSGCFGYDYDFDGTRAKRSWFLTDGGLIQLVADVSDREGRQLVQTLNQCRADGPVRYRTASAIETETEPFSYSGPLRAVEHAGVGYVFPNARTVHLEAETRTGTWQTINLNGSAEPMREDIFSLAFELTPDDHNGTHFFILPGGLSGIEGAERAIERWSVLRNDSECQAIHDLERDEVLANFYAKGRVTLSDGFHMNVRQPCSVILQLSDEGMVIHAADPTKSLAKLHLSLNVGYSGLDGQIDGGPGYTHIDVDLPEGIYRGLMIEPVVLELIAR